MGTSIFQKLVQKRIQYMQFPFKNIFTIIYILPVVSIYKETSIMTSGFQWNKELRSPHSILLRNQKPNNNKVKNQNKTSSQIHRTCHRGMKLHSNLERTASECRVTTTVRKTSRTARENQWQRRKTSTLDVDPVRTAMRVESLEEP